MESNNGKIHTIGMKQFAIYTACIGGYDDIHQPEVVDERFDYYLFTDDVEEKQIGVWKVRHVEYTNPDKTRIARWVKTHPCELLSEYTTTLWMDSSLQIISQKVYDRYVELVNNNVDVASVKHPKRDCIYEEAFEVASRQYPGALEYEDIALKWCHQLWKEQYPMHNGLFETSILFRRNNTVVNELDDLWWECININSKRDQLSFNYVLWKITPTVGEFLKNGEHMLKSDKVRYRQHATVSIRKALPLNYWQQIRYKYRVQNRVKALKYWYVYLQSPLPILLLHFHGTIVAISNLFMFKIKKQISRYVQKTQT